jgi:hypothetical protein
MLPLFYTPFIEIKLIKDNPNKDYKQAQVQAVSQAQPVSKQP